MNWLLFIFLYFLLGFVPASMMSCDYDEGEKIMSVIYLFWPLFLGWKILKFIFYTIPKDIVWAIKYLIKENF